MRIPLGIINLKPKSTRPVTIDTKPVPVLQPPLPQPPLTTAPIPQPPSTPTPVPESSMTPISSTLGSKPKERLKDKILETTSANLYEHTVDDKKEDKTIDDKETGEYVE